MRCKGQCLLAVMLAVMVWTSEANLAVGRSSLRPSGKRSIALGRFSLRPGKRSLESEAQSIENMIGDPSSWQCSVERLSTVNDLVERAAALLEEYTLFLDTCSGVEELVDRF